MAEGPWGRGVAVVPPIFLIFFLLPLYYYFILLFKHDYEYGPPLLAIVSFCMLDLCLLWQKILFIFKKTHYVSLFAKLYYLLRLGPPIFKIWLHPSSLRLELTESKSHFTRIKKNV